MGTVLYPEGLRFTYLPQIAFQSEAERRDILRRGLAELEKGNVPAAARALGQKYKEKIESDYAPQVSIRHINERVGYGAFAEEPIKKGEFVGEYVGIVRENMRIYFAPLNNYCYEYPVPDFIGRSFVIDASSGNFTRFINHSKRPSLKPYYAFYEGFYHLIFFALRKIEIGEQLTYEYGPSYWYIRSRPEEL